MRKLVAAILGAAVMALLPAAFAQDSSSSIQGEFETPAADWLLVQSSASLTSDGKTITLTGVSPQTVIFADRPDRMAGTVPTKTMVDDWAKGKDSLEKDPPNASLASIVDGKEVVTVVELTNPKLDGKNLTYDIKVLDGTVPQAGAETTLFIDWWYGRWGGICHRGPWGGVRCWHRGPWYW
jgi:hypothetical protein